MPRARADADELRLRWTTAVRGLARARAAIQASTQAIVTAAWRRVGDPYSPSEVSGFTVAAAAAVRTGRGRTTDVVAASMRRVLDDAGVTARARPAAAAEPRGIPLEQEFLRPAAEYRWLISQGRDVQDALDAARLRAQILAEDDLATAARDAAAQIFQAVPQVIGYRRVIHPEQAQRGSCGLCVAASLNMYRKSVLLPLHGRCHCGVLPVLDGAEDVAQAINGRSTEELYRQLGLTKRTELAKVRFAVHQHGELGPQLRAAGQHFRGPSDLS
jgi:hypothetical protein